MGTSPQTVDEEAVAMAKGAGEGAGRLDAASTTGEADDSRNAIRSGSFAAMGSSGGGSSAPTSSFWSRTICFLGFDNEAMVSQ